MNKIAALAVVLLFCVSCSQTITPPSTFNKRGVSFSMPAGWKVTDEKPYDRGGYYLSVEKDGFNCSGLITMVWVPGSMELTKGIKMHQEELRSDPTLKPSPPKFSPIQSGDFKGIPAETSTYTMSVMGIAHSGQLWTFSQNEHYFIVSKQEADEDHAENKAEFAWIFESLEFGEE